MNENEQKTQRTLLNRVTHPYAPEFISQPYTSVALAEHNAPSPQSNEMRRVWWKGAITSAIKGIPQGIALGLLGAGLLFGGIYLLGMVAPSMAFGLATDFGSFLFSNAAVSGIAATAAAGGSALPAFGLASLNILPIMALNTVLTAVGNFLTGGQIACNAYKQEVEHRANEQRIHQLESREQQIEMKLAKPNANVQAIIARGPRTQQSFETAEAERQNQPPHQPHYLQ